MNLTESQIRNILKPIVERFLIEKLQDGGAELYDDGTGVFGGQKMSLGMRDELDWESKQLQKSAQNNWKLKSDDYIIPDFKVGEKYEHPYFQYYKIKSITPKEIVILTPKNRYTDEEIEIKVPQKYWRVYFATPEDKAHPIENEIEEATTTFTAGNYQYTVPFGGDKETTDRSKPLMQKSWEDGRKGLTESQIRKIIEDKVRKYLKEEESPEYSTKKIKNALRSEIVNMAVIARDVFPNESEDSARSRLSKISRGILPIDDYLTAIAKSLQQHGYQLN